MERTDAAGAMDALPEAVLLYEEIVRMARIYREDGGGYREELEALYDYALFLHRRGNDEKALRAAALLDSFHDPADTDPDHLDNRAALKNLMGQCHMAREEYEDAEARFREALELYRRLAAEDGDAEPDVAENCVRLAEVLTRTFRYSAAARLYREALELYRRFVDEDPEEFMRPLAEVCHALTPFLDGRRPVRCTLPAERARTFAMCDRALWDCVTDRALDRDGTQRAELSVALELLDGLLPETAFPDEGARLLQELEAQAREQTRDNPADFDAALVKLCLDKANELLEQRRLEEAEVLARRALEMCQRLADADPDGWEPELAGSYHRLGFCIDKTNRLKEAEASYLKALEIWRRLAEVDPDRYQEYVASTCNNLGGLYRRTEQYEEAEVYQREALEILRVLVEKDPDAYEVSFMQLCGNFALLLNDTDRPLEAEQYYREGLEFYRKHREGKPEEETTYAWANDLFAILLKNTGRIEEAERRYRESMELLRGLAKDHPRENNLWLAEVCHNLANLELSYKHNPGAAVQLFAEAVELFHQYPYRARDEELARRGLSAAKAALGEQEQLRGRYYGGQADRPRRA